MSERCSLDEAFALLAPDFKPKAAAAAIEHAAHTDDHFPLYCDGNVVEVGIAKHITVVPESKDGPADILWNGPGFGWAPRAHKWELDRDAVLALKPQPDTRVESAQAIAITAQQKAEAATAEMASMRAELEKALAEAEKARAKMEELQAALQTVTEQMEKSEARAEAAEARAAREQAKAVKERAEAAEARVEASHLKPGRKFKDNWPMLVAKEMFRLACRDDEILENITELTKHMRDFLEGEIGWRGPNDDKEIRAQIRFLRRH